MPPKMTRILVDSEKINLKTSGVKVRLKDCVKNSNVVYSAVLFLSRS